MKATLASQGLLLAAVGGLVTGCAESAKPTKESASAKPSSTTMAHDKSDKNCCVGKNDCKGKGGCAVPIKETMRKKTDPAPAKK